MTEAVKPIMPLLLEFLTEYTPQPYPGKIIVFPATHEFFGINDNKLGWSELGTGGVEVYEVPSSHRAMLLEPNKAEILGQLLVKELNKIS